MIKHTHSHRLYPLSLEREKRLCYEVSGPFGSPDLPPPRSTAREISDNVSQVPGWILEKMTMLTAETGAFLGKAIISLPVGFLNGLEEAWQNNRESGEALKQDIINASSFFHHFPFIGQYFEGIKIKDVESYRNLTNQTKWVAAFNDPDIFVNPVGAEKMPESGVVGPYELLKSFTPLERQHAYLEFVDQVIPQHIQKNNGIPTATEHPIVADRFATLGTGQIKTTEALKGIFDMRGERRIPSDTAQIIAEQTLNNHYLAGGPNNALGSLKEDYTNALAGARFAGIRNVRTSVAQLQNSPYASPRLRAALRLCVVRNEHLAPFSQAFERTEFRDSTLRGVVRKNLDDLTGIVNTDVKRDALGAKEIFNNLSGIEKLVLLGGAVWALKSSFGKGIAGAGALLYFGMKFGFKDPDPFKTASNWLSKGINFNGRIPNEAMPGGPVDPRSRVDAMMTFLKEYDPAGFDNLEMQATGFSLVSDMRMSDIANNMKVNGDPISQSMKLELNVPGMQKGMEAIRKNNKWKSNTNRFFQDPDSVHELTGGFGYVFFNLASQNPANFEYVERYKEAMRKLPANESIADIPFDIARFSDPSMRAAAIEANAMYIKLVLLGQGAAAADRRPFGDVVTSITKLPQFSPRQNLPENRVTNTDAGGGAGKKVEGHVSGESTRRGTAEGADRDPASPDTTRGAADPKTGRDTASSDAERGTLDPKTDRDAASSSAKRGSTESKTDRDAASSPAERGSAEAKTDRDPASPDTTRGAADPKTGRDTASSDTERGTSDPSTDRDTAKSGTNRNSVKPPERSGTSSDTSRNTNSGTERGKSDSADRDSTSPDSSRSRDSGTNRGSAGDIERDFSKNSTNRPNAKPGENALKDSVENALNSVKENDNLIGTGKFIVEIGGAKKEITFTQDKIIIGGNTYKLRAKPFAKSKNFEETMFTNISVVRNDKNEKVLSIGASVGFFGSTGTMSVLEITEMLSALDKADSYQGKLNGGKGNEIRIEKVEK